MVYIGRDAQPVPKTVWTIQFGAGWTLQWSRESDPVVQDNLGNTYPCKSEDQNVQEYRDNTELEWIFIVENGDLWISGTAIRSKWVIPSPTVAGMATTIGSGPITVSASAGSLTCSADDFAFDQTGSIVTDWMDLGAPVNTTDPTVCGPGTATPVPLTVAEGGTGWYYRVYGDIPDACGAIVSLYRPNGTPAINGTQARFQLTLTGNGDTVGTYQTAANAVIAPNGITGAGNAAITITAQGLATNSVQISQLQITGGPASSYTTIPFTVSLAGVPGFPRTFTISVFSSMTAAQLAAAIVAQVMSIQDFALNYTLTASTQFAGLLIATAVQPGVYDPTFNMALGAAGGFPAVPTSTDATVWNPVTYPIPVAQGDSTFTLATRAAYLLGQDPYLTALYTVSAPDTAPGLIILTAVAANTAACYPNDPTLNLAITNGTCSGITPSLTTVSAQGVTAMRAGSGTTGGTIQATVAGAFTGSPITVFYVASSGNMAATVASTVLTALQANATLAPLFTMSQTNAVLSLQYTNPATIDSTLSLTVGCVAPCAGITATTGISGGVTITTSSQTPLIGKFEILRMPTFTTPTQVWLNATPWLAKGRAEFHKVWASNLMELTYNHWLNFSPAGSPPGMGIPYLNHPEGVINASVSVIVGAAPGSTPTYTLTNVTLLQALADTWGYAGVPVLNGYAIGQYAVYVELAYHLYDPVVRAFVNPDTAATNALGQAIGAAGGWVGRMEGITQFDSEQGGLYDTNAHAHTLSLKVHNNYVTFGNALGRVPCLEGYTVDQALSLLAKCAGVLPSRIHVLTGTIPTTLQPSGQVVNEVYAAFTSLPNGGVLTDPGKRYYQSTWQPAPNDTADTWIQKIQTAFPDVQVQFGMNGELYIYYQAYAAQPVGDLYSTTGASDALHTFNETTLERDWTGIKNMITIEGKTPEGNPLYASVLDTGSIAGPADNFLGVIQQDWRTDDSLTNQTDVAQAATAAFQRRKSGHATYRVGKPAGNLSGAGLLLTPPQLIKVIDPTVALPTTANYDAAGSPAPYAVMMVSDVTLEIVSPQLVQIGEITLETYIP